MAQRYRKRLVLWFVTQCCIKLHFSKVNSLLLHCMATFDCSKLSYFSERNRGKNICKLFYFTCLIITIMNQTLQQIKAFNFSWKPKYLDCRRNSRLSCAERRGRNPLITGLPHINANWMTKYFVSSLFHFLFVCFYFSSVFGCKSLKNKISLLNC